MAAPSSSSRAPFLTTRLGRRLFAGLMVVALVPIALLAALSYRTVTDELYDQADVRLHRAARATGMLLVRRLILRAEAHAPPGAARRPGSTGAALRLEPGDAGAPPRILLVHEGPDGARTRVVPTEALFADLPDLVLPDRGEHLVLSQGRLLATSLEGSVEPAAAWTTMPPARELDEWSHGGTVYLGRAREVFLDASLSAPPWTVVILEPRDAVLGPVAAFQSAFLLAVALSLLAVPLLALGQIRRRLVPLEKLRAGARRIGARDLETRVDVAGNDELAEVAGAFNAMAHDLSHHFAAMDTLLDIDREILQASDAVELARVVARRSFALTSEDTVAVAVAWLGEDDPGGGASYVSRGPDAALRRHGPPTPEEAAAWAGHPWLDCTRDAPPGLPTGVPEKGVREVRVYPMELAGRLLGAVLVAHAEAASHGDAHAPYLRQLADQAAMAFSHLRERERSRALAYYDRVTRLPNRFMLHERLRQALRVTAGGPRCTAVCLIAVEGVTRIFETLGQAAADALLQEVALRLTASHVPGDAFRLERDEFAVLLSELDAADGAARAAERLVEVLERPFGAPGAPEVVLAPAVGVAVAPQDGDAPELLEQSARSALRAARLGGRGAYRFYSPSMQAHARDRLALEGALRRAVHGGELEVAYQPIVDVASGALLGAEALVRWTRDGVAVSPGVFVPLAEQAGLIGELGTRVLRTACAELRAWLDEAPGLGIHVNVSPLQLEQGDLPGLVRTVLAETGLPRGALTLEITESTLTDHSDATLRLLDDVSRLGVGLAIDDFGTGYSSLVQLRELPADVLKIDRCFVERVPEDAADAAVVRAVIDLAHGRGLRVVAEGVETEAQLAFLREVGCDEAQGFLFDAALPADAFRKRVREAALRGEAG